MCLLKLKLLMLKNSVFHKTEYSKLKLFTVLTFTILLLWGEFFLFYHLFSLLGGIQGVGIIIIEKLFFLFFMAIFFLLVFSNIIVSYSTIFNSKEIPILMTYPLKYIDMFDIKFIESILLSSWAFFFITLPFIFAFGIYKNLTLSFYLASIIYLIPFITISGVLGSFVTLGLGKLFNKWWFKILLILVVVGLIPLLIIYAKKSFNITGIETENVAFTLGNLMPHFKISQFPLLPSYWLSNGLLFLSSGKYNNSMLFFLFALSNCLLGFLILRFLAKKSYYDSWESIRSTQAPIYKPGFNIFFKKVGDVQLKAKRGFDFVVNKFTPFNSNRILIGFTPSKKAFINKDIKLFLRDPVQWSQGLMFFGLLAVYFGNLENLSYNLATGYWKNAIVFLNMMATSLTLASLGVRFIFPQLSLEGNKAWLLKLAPVSFKKILLGKFWFSFILAVFITEGLIFLSNYMLEVQDIIFYFTSVIMVMICFGLVGLSCGLGAVFPNFKQNNPAIIVSGIGGTLNFIFSLIYLGLIVWILAPFLYNYIINQNVELAGMLFRLSILTGLIFILSCITGLIPMYVGIRRLERMEF